MNYKNLFLGIRQYDCDISDDDFDKIIDIALQSDFDIDSPGYQSIVSNSGGGQGGMFGSSYKPLIYKHPILKILQESFLKCCWDFFKLKNSNEGCRLWFYQDWGDNPHRDGQYWHDHLNTTYGLSSIMYLKLPDEASTTGFSINADARTVGSPDLEPDMIYLPRVTKKWFIFPNWYPHIPGKCDSGERRIVIGTDYWVSPTNGKPSLGNLDFY